MKRMTAIYTAVLIGIGLVAVVPLWGSAVGCEAAGPHHTYHCGPQTTGPTVAYSSYLGAELLDAGQATAVGADGSIYVAGQTQSTTFPGVEAPPKRAPQHGIDAYVAKFSPTGTLTAVLWINAASASAEDEVYGLVVDDEGAVYATGYTRSEDFCAFTGRVPGYQTDYQGNTDGFVMKIAPDMRTVEYCTFLGGNDLDIGRAIVVDDDGRAYVTGGTWSTDFPTAGQPLDDTHNGGRDVFVARLSADGTILETATFYGGDNQEEGRAIARAADGHLLIGGWSRSADLPLTAGEVRGEFDAFALRLTAELDTITYAVTVGGAGDERGTAVAFGADGHGYLGGYGDDDGFVARLSLTGPTVYTHAIGGDGIDLVTAVAVDEADVVWATGETASTDLAVDTDSLDADLDGPHDGLVAAVEAHTGRRLYTSYLGGDAEDTGLALTAVDGTVVIAGQTRSADFVTTADAYSRINSGDYDIFVTRLTNTAVAAPAPIFLPYAAVSGP